jgi:CspA family cold shock protein
MQEGFGFIQSEDGGKGVFVHITALQAAGLNSLNDGQKMTFEVVRERGKEAAANLKLA